MRGLIFLFLFLSALPFQTFLRQGQVGGFLVEVRHEVHTMIYDVRAHIDLSLLPDDSN